VARERPRSLGRAGFRALVRVSPASMQIVSPHGQPVVLPVAATFLSWS